MADQSELGMKFSTLNVNASVFVPNFGSPPSASSPPADEEPSAPVDTETAETATSSPIKSATPTEEPSPTKSEIVEQPAEVAVATPTEQLTDKSPAG